MDTCKVKNIFYIFFDRLHADVSCWERGDVCAQANSLRTKILREGCMMHVIDELG